MKKRARNQNDRMFFTKVTIVLAGSFLIFFISVSLSRMDFVFPRVVSDFSGNLFKNKFKDIKKFSSEDDFKNYLAAASKQNAFYGGLGMGGAMMNQEMAPMDMKSANGVGGGAPERISQTNVQVIGIDEPDIVKTDGKEIYFSGQQRFYPGPMMRGDVSSGISFEEQQRIDQKVISQYPIPNAETKIINAFPPADLALEGKIDKQGDLLLDNNNLVIFSSSGFYGSKAEIVGYDVSNPAYPQKRWNLELEENSAIIASRLYNHKIYLVLKNAINEFRPCPVKPLASNSSSEKPLTISCGEIYHPVRPIPVDATYVALILDPNAGGKVEKTVSFVGSSGSSVIYVSENAIYASYTYNESVAKFFSGFIAENPNLFPLWLAEKVKKLEGYDISEDSKFSELMTLIQKYTNSLGADERLKAQSEMQNRMSEYYKRHKRDLEKTGIFKIDLDKFQIAASGAVPGHLLNNFAMDEYQNNLRVATTVGSQWGIFGGLGGSGTANDVYVLDKNLKTSGSVKDLGETEQIYSVRFIEDKGYVVTFRQTDPFFTLDLAEPKNPKLAGELKIPGYSSYLHSLDATHILGVGMESNKVKISLFDVSDKNNPVELHKYMLDEYWTEVANNYHAFLLDTKHKVFFLPGGKGGYVFSYKADLSKCGTKDPAEDAKCAGLVAKPYKIELKKAVNQNSVKRAIYINDYLYIIGEDKITVLDETDWQKINGLNY